MAHRLHRTRWVRSSSHLISRLPLSTTAPMPLFEPRTVGFVRYFIRAYPVRSALMVVLLLQAGLLEGIGVITLLPVLELVTAAPDAEVSALGRAVAEGLAVVGLQPTLAVLLGIIVVAMSAKALLLWLAMRQVGFTVAQVTTDLRMALLRALMEARWRYYASQSTGQLANAISSEAHRASGAYQQSCNMLAGAFQILVYLAVAFMVSWPIALGTIVVGILFLVLLRGFVRMARNAGQDETNLMRSLVGRLTDALQGIKPIRAMGRERHLQPLLEQEAEGLNQALRRQVTAEESLHLFQEPTLVLLLSAGLFAALTLGGQPFASVLVLAFVFYRLMKQVNHVQSRYQVLTMGESAFWSIREKIDEAEAHREVPTGTRPPPPLEEGVQLRDVRFSHDDTPVLRDVSMEVPAGRFVALHGPSGGGKTTIADLIIGFHRPHAGRVEVDGIPLDEIDLLRWRGLVGYVPQEVFLFHDTVFRNVTLGDESIGPDEVEAALRAAGAWEFVAARHRGIQTVIGEAGSRLSGGQRQRISIARALVHRPRLLILDEATTGLDPATEEGIVRTLRELRGRVTILAISHQPTLRHAADVVYSLEGGTVTRVDRGGEEAQGNQTMAHA